MTTISAEEARTDRRARMIAAAAARADVLLAAARAACEALSKLPPARVLAALEPLGETGTDYDEWQTTMEELPAATLFAGNADLQTALRTNDPRALAVALGVLAQIDPARTYALVRNALPLESTHFAPNYVEAYIQRALEPVLDRILVAIPPEDLAEMFASGRLVLERIPAAQVAQLAVLAVGETARGPALGYVDRDDAEAFLAKHPCWTEPAALRGPIAAGFALDPATASSRFGAWLTPKAVATESGATIAHDILRAGLGIMTDHDGTRLASGYGSFLDVDPRWGEVLEPLAQHPRLGTLVRSSLGGSKRTAAATKTMKTATKTMKTATKTMKPS